MRKADDLPPLQWRKSRKSGVLTYLEPLGPVQDCCGRTLPLMILILILVYLSTAIGLAPGGSSTVHMYTQTIHRTTQLTALVGRLSGIQTQRGQWEDLQNVSFISIQDIPLFSVLKIKWFYSVGKQQ